jgi:UPF0716 family protein affecting phage T7 exclusion
MWFRRHWYWPSGYIVVGIIVALLTNNIHLSSLSGILLSILAVLLWPFILGAALCRLLGFHLTRTPQASISSGAPSRSVCGTLCD